MTFFEMVKYHDQKYPAEIPLHIEECAAHMDTVEIKAELNRSLHTEYSYGKRKFNSELMARFPILADTHKNGVSQLWYNAEWSRRSADFVIALSGDDAPSVVEIHPPFNDYTNMDNFVENYRAFEDIILERFPQTDILIENRCGSVYKGGKFLISKLSDVEHLCSEIEKRELKLQIAYDVPQIYTAHNAKKQSTYIELLQNTKAIRSFIGGVHLWGKRKSASGRLVSHCGDLNSYFTEDTETKTLFLREFCHCFDDGICRKMVLEVNSGNNDLQSIILDLTSTGVKFI